MLGCCHVLPAGAFGSVAMFCQQMHLGVLPCFASRCIWGVLLRFASRCIWECCHVLPAGAFWECCHVLPAGAIGSVAMFCQQVQLGGVAAFRQQGIQACGNVCHAASKSQVAALCCYLSGKPCTPHCSLHGENLFFLPQVTGISEQALGHASYKMRLSVNSSCCCSTSCL